MSDEIIELGLKEKKKDDKFEDENAVMETEKLQQENGNQAANTPTTLQPLKRSHEEESSEQMNEIKRPKLTAKTKSIPNWLIEVLAWIKRTEMANSSLSTSSWTFRQLCWPKLHGNVKERCVQRLTSFYVQDSETFSLRSKLCKSSVSWFCFPTEEDDEDCIAIPIGNIDPPKYITGFRQIHLFFLDGPILEFLKNMLPFFNKIFLHFRCEIHEWNMKNIRIGPIRRLLTILAPKICELNLYDLRINLCDFNRLFPGYIQEIQSMEMDNPRRSDWDLLMEWFNTERADGRPKIFSVSIGGEDRDDFVDRVKQENEAESNNPPLKPMKRSHEEESSEQMNIEIKRPKLTAKSIPNWLIEVLAWIKRTEMANSSLSTSSWTFRQLCWPKLHGNVKERCVQRLTSFYVQDSETFSLRSKLCKGNSDCFDFPSENYTTIPIAKIDQPKYIISFRQIHLCFLDGQILEFLKILLPSINKIFIHFRSQIHKWDEDNIRIGPIRRLLSILAPKTFALTLIDFGIDLCVLNRLFPGFIDEIQYIETAGRISEWDLLLKWLNNDRTDGKPKMLLPFIRRGHENDFMDRIKKEFFLSKRKATFIIYIGQAFMEDQTFENEETGEVLSIYLMSGTVDQDNERIQFIVRHQKGMEYLRKNWEKRNTIVGDWGDEFKFTGVGVDIQEIGLF